MYRIQTMSKAITQTHKLVEKTKAQLEQRLEHLHRGQNEVKRFQTLRMKVNLLREQLQRETSELNELRLKRQKTATGELLTNHLNPIAKSDAYLTNDDNNHIDAAPVDNQGNVQSNDCTNGDDTDVWPDVNVDRCERMAYCFERMKREGQQLRTRQQQIEQKRRDLTRLQDFIYFRRKQLFSELFLLFPINGPAPDGHTITNVQLPSSEQLISVDDHQVEAALGFVCHVLIVVSKLIDVPLRFDLLFHGSQNWIVDKTHSELESYPLFHRNGKRDRSRFNYALFLLNRNVAQLRQHFQLPTTDLRFTLNNLLGLFRERLLYKRDDLNKMKSKFSADVATAASSSRPVTPLLNEPQSSSSYETSELSHSNWFTDLTFAIIQHSNSLISTFVIISWIMIVTIT